MQLYGADGGLGVTADDVTAYFEMVLKFRHDGAIPPAAAISETTGTELQIMRFPSFTGAAKDRGTWVGIASWWVVPSTGDQTAAATDFVNWWVNSVEVGEISLAERGLPPNTEVLAAITDKLDDNAKVSAQFMQDIQDEFGGPMPSPPAGSGNTESTLMRHTTDLLFDKSDPADTAKGFIDEVLASLQR